MSAHKARAVFKFGSEVVTNERGVDLDRITSHAHRINAYCGAENLSELIVSSGSVAAGRIEAPHIKDDQILAGLGSAAVVMAWKRAYALYGRLVSQNTATDHEILDTYERGNFRRALLKDLDAGIVPNFNTNDKMNEDEILKRPLKGENDGPAAHIAILIDAVQLFLLTERNGVFDDRGEVMREIPYDEEYRQDILGMLEKRGPLNQGIHRKVEAGFEASNHRIDVWIAGADEDFHRVVAGESGTHLAPKPQGM